MEGDLGVQLYIRPRRGGSLRPTKAGQAVMDALTDSEGARPGGNTIETGIPPASRRTHDQPIVGGRLSNRTRTHRPEWSAPTGRRSGRRAHRQR
ncbi:hypothetical protein [Actinacidiphila sp. DG2A-62]|uniref:hypothetical protein n=1 Tax=Actinacidiphila sp. DG2A-62 TaxID=3108821 RepID=UPI003FA3788F